MCSILHSIIFSIVWILKDSYMPPTALAWQLGVIFWAHNRFWPSTGPLGHQPQNLVWFDPAWIWLNYNIDVNLGMWRERFISVAQTSFSTGRLCTLDPKYPKWDMYKLRLGLNTETPLSGGMLVKMSGMGRGWTGGLGVQRRGCRSWGDWRE